VFRDRPLLILRWSLYYYYVVNMLNWNIKQIC